MTSSFSLIATIPAEFDETYHNDLVSAVLNDQIEDRTISAACTEIVESSVGLRGNNVNIAVPLIACDCIRLSPTPSISFKSNLVRLVAVFCPSSLVASAREQTQQQIRTYDDEVTKTQPQRPVVEWLGEPTKLSSILLSMIHPILAQNFVVRAILTHQNIDRHSRRFGKPHAPGDVIIINLSHCPYETIVEELLEEMNCEIIRYGTEAILKVLLLSKLELDVSRTLVEDSSGSNPTSTAPSFDTRKLRASNSEIPACAVCLFRIDPIRLGLPRPPSHQICSKFCSSSSSSGHNNTRSCPRQRLLLPWPPPNHCETCHIIQNYWKKYSDDPTTYNERDEVFCNLCGLQETLWVCLTCAFVGCGRYSNKHAAEHNDTTHHPFCLELSTLRIWSYVDTEYVHRVDLLECPGSLPNLHQLPSITRGLSPPQRPSPNSIAHSHYSTTQARASHDHHDSYSNNNYLDSVSAQSDFDFPSRSETDHYERMVASSFASVDEKTPKKATMIGEEYEVLLQSALEDQAQYYEGEIAWLRATLSAEQLDRKTVTPEEESEIQRLGLQNSQLRMDIEQAGRELLNAQALEAKYRAESQRLLREQSIAQNLLKKINEESMQERNQGRLLIEDLELQISDLTANQRMMQQFSQNEDLKNSQILGAERQTPDSTKPPASGRNKKGKKISKSFRNAT